MQREKFRALEIDPRGKENWVVSDSIKWFGDALFLKDTDESWKQCYPNTRSVSYPNIVDKEGTRIFASLDEKNGVGGDLLREMDTEVLKAVYSEELSAFMLVGDMNIFLDKRVMKLFKVTGISKG